MNCPSCQAPLDEIAKFCGQCGKPVPAKSQENLSSRDLFEIPEEEEGSGEDEFIQEPAPPAPAPSPSADSEDFFEEFEENEPGTEEVEEDERKVFSEEDDPTMEPESSDKFQDAKIDKKTLKKIRKRASQKDAEYGSLKAIGYLLIHIFYWLPPALLFYTSWLNASPRWIYLSILFPLLLWPLLRTRGWNLRFSSHLSFLIGTSLTSLMLIKFKNDLSQADSLIWKQAAFSLDWNLTTCVLYFSIAGLQIIIASLFRARIPLVILIALSLILSYCALEIFLALGGVIPFFSCGSGLDPLTPFLSPYIGQLSLYFAPLYVLVHFIWPLACFYFLILSITHLFQKKFSVASSEFFILCAFISLWFSLLLPLERIPAETRPLSVIPYLQPVYETLSSLLSTL